MADALTDMADNYFIKFPDNSTAEQRALLMCSGLFMDYSYFEGEKDDST